MASNDISAKEFSLIQEMMEAVDVMSGFDPEDAAPFARRVERAGRLFMSGEGSSRIFPAKNAMARVMQEGSPFPVATDGGRQAMEYDLSKWAVLVASNSGRTRETLSLLAHLRERGHELRLGLTTQKGTPLEELCNGTHILSCGPENAVAATKSVVEQALFCQALVCELMGSPLAKTDLARASAALRTAVSLNIPQSIVDKVSKAKRIYFAGRNNGVAEELTLKANEITRLPSAYLENTYAVHGIEEVMRSDEVVVVIEPFEAELDKFKEVLEKGVGMTLVAISSARLPVPTILIPSCAGFDSYVQLAAGWRLLVETGLANKIDLDTPRRARKIGNEALHPAA